MKALLGIIASPRKLGYSLRNVFNAGRRWKRSGRF
jgi:hypothetical protein